MTRSRLIRQLLGRWALFWLLMVGSGPAAHAQPRADSAREAPVAPAPDSASAPAQSAPVPKASSDWSLMLGVLGGIALGVLGARMWARRSARPAASEGPARPSEPVPEPMRRKPAENVLKSPSVQSLRQVQDTPPASGSLPMPAPKPAGAGGKFRNKPKNDASPSRPSQSWPANVPHRPAAMNPTPLSVPPTPDDQPLETGQTIEWAAPTSTPPAIQELIDATAREAPLAPDARVESLTALEEAAAVPVAATGPVHYYAPAPDVPSIEHRKLSPNPLPQMPLLITLPHAEATTAQFSFSPQADQSRIIGNGVRELKEFFAFELPPTEQFTAIKNLAPGKLEKRDDTWYVVQKADIALS